MNEALELLTRTLCDLQPLTSTDGTYLYCQTKDNQQSVFKAAKLLESNLFTSRILILKTKSKSGYPGFDKWRHSLKETGIPVEKITGVSGDETTSINTLIESESLIRFAKKRGYRTIFVVAPPFQQLRAFMTSVTVAMREYPDLSIYSHPGITMPWQDEVVHSQGALTARRYDLIHGEFERIDKYQKKGDLASYEQVLAYLNNRTGTGADPYGLKCGMPLHKQHE